MRSEVSGNECLERRLDSVFFVRPSVAFQRRSLGEWCANVSGPWVNEFWREAVHEFLCKKKEQGQKKIGTDAFILGKFSGLPIVGDLGQKSRAEADAISTQSHSGKEIGLPSREPNLQKTFCLPSRGAVHVATGEFLGALDGKWNVEVASEKPFDQIAVGDV